jgi:hypothetical protein
VRDVKPLLVLYDSDKMELFKNFVEKLPVREDLIIAKSLEYFNDDAPCFLHRSAVLQRLFAELDHYFSGFSAIENIPIGDIRGDIADILRINKQVSTVTYKKYAP